MRLFCWNINALVPTIPNFRLTHGSVRGFFDSQKADVVCFQETKLLSEEKLTADVACVEGFESFWTFSRDKKGYSGVATYVATQFSPVSAQVDCLGNEDEDINREGRCVVTDLGAFVLLNVYAPNAGDRKSDNGRIDYKLRFLDALKHKADLFRDAGKEVMIVGDLNVAASQADVHKKYSYDRMYSAAEKEALQALLNDYTDIWRRLHPDADNVFTVWDEKTSARVFNEGVRIDYVLLSAGLLQRVVSCEVISTLPPKWSDHAALLLELRDIPPAQPHPPCALSSARMKRFAKPKASIASMFAKRRADARAAPAAKRARTDVAAAEMDAAAVSATGSQGVPEHGADDVAAVSVPAAKRARSGSAAAEVDAAAVSAGGSQIEAVPEKPDVSKPTTDEGQAPVSLEGKEHLASASMQLRPEEQAGKTEADEVSEGGAQRQAGVTHVSQTGTIHLAAETSCGGGSGEVLPAAANHRDSQNSQAVTPLKGKASRSKSSSKAGEVPPSPKQKSIRGFFTAQS